MNSVMVSNVPTAWLKIPDPMNTIAFLVCALIVALWAFNDFHQPFARTEIRDSVSKGRYVLGAGMYVAGALLLYMALVPLFLALAPRVWNVFGFVRSGDFLEGTGKTVRATGFASSTFAVLVLMAVPLLPFVSGLLGKVRDATQSLAYFPTGLNRLLTILGNVGTKFERGAIDRVARELGRYGIGESELRAPGNLSVALGFALEIETIYLRTAAARTGGDREQSALQLISGQTVGLYLNYCRFQRHLADAFIVKRQIGEGEQSDDALTALCEFVEDEGNALVVKFRKTIAQAALSRVAGVTARVNFLKGMGYEVWPELALPFWPVALTFLVVVLGNAALSITQILASSQRLSQHKDFSLTDPIGRVNVLLVFCTQALSLCAAVLWAIAPKKDFPDARPSLKTLPWNFYLIVVPAAYATSVLLYAILYFIRPDLPFVKAAGDWWRPALLLAIAAPVLTFVLSVLVDLHLMGRQPLGRRGRFADGGLVTLAGLGTQYLLMGILVPLVIFHGAHQQPFHFSWRQFSVYSLGFAAVWFAIGFSVPVTVAMALQRILSVYRNLPDVSKALASAGAADATIASGGLPGSS